MISSVCIGLVRIDVAYIEILSSYCFDGHFIEHVYSNCNRNIKTAIISRQHLLIGVKDSGPTEGYYMSLYR